MSEEQDNPTLAAFKLSAVSAFANLLSGEIESSRCGEYLISRYGSGIYMSKAFAQLLLDRLRTK